jgi:thimet oligopeptidase
MRSKILLLLASPGLVLHLQAASGNATKTLASFQKQAAKFNATLQIPEFETTPQMASNAVEQTIARANAALDDLAKQDPAKVGFSETFHTLDDINYGAALTANRLSLIKETSTNALVREATTDALKKLQDWAVGLDYREDVYRVMKAAADNNPRLEGEDAKLLKETMRDYRRAGLELPKSQRDEVERLRKEVARLATDFETNVTDAKKPVKFKKADLDGVPESFLNQVKTGDDEYTVMANITFQFIAVMENAKKEETRKRLQVEHDNLAREKNVALLKQILQLRNDIAHRLGYKSWADFQIEPKMAKNAATARDFLQRLNKGLQPKFDAEIDEFRQLKVKETGDAKAKIHLWDWRYFSNELKREKYTVDTEKLRDYFPYDKVLHGMFDIYQRIFGLKIEEIAAPYKWTDDLKLFAVSDSKSGEPLGLFYLDMFPREGKYNHFAQFGIIEGKLRRDGKYQRPTVALVCNFPPPQGDKPSLLAHHEVETLFHEFGHAMNSILTRANYSRFSGTSVPRDFVEAPSQMLENWVWEKAVLDSFAGHYKNPGEKIPASVVAKLKDAKLATVGTFYRRQISFALLDLALHGETTPEDPVKVSNQILSEVFFPVPENTAFVAYFGHLMGYDAGYYGYAWADAIAADMATVFEKSSKGYFDEKVGRKLRDEIYAPGDSRDVNVSIQRFLGRPQAIEPFLKTLGIGPTSDAPAVK